MKPMPKRCRACGRDRFWWYEEIQTWICYHCGEHHD
jgi:hypothetical protein